MKDNTEKTDPELFQDVNANRRRITIDENGKPVKISDSMDDSANNFKPSALTLES